MFIVMLILVVWAPTEDGTKELLAVVDGYRESTQSWRELLGQLKRLGLSAAPNWPSVTIAGLLDRSTGRIRSDRPTALLGS
jgi:transposase-like protein